MSMTEDIGGGDTAPVIPEYERTARRNVAGIILQLDKFIELGYPFLKYFMFGDGYDVYTNDLHSYFTDVLNSRGIKFRPLEEGGDVAVAKMEHDKLLWRRTDYTHDGVYEPDSSYSKYSVGVECGYLYVATEIDQLPHEIQLPEDFSPSSVLA